MAEIGKTSSSIISSSVMIINWVPQPLLQNTTAEMAMHLSDLNGIATQAIHV